MPMSNKFRDTMGPIVRPLGELFQQRRTARFVAKVRNALAELGLHVPRFRLPLKRLFEDVCVACYTKQGEKANPHALAIEFFLRLMIEYPNVVGNAVMFNGVLLKSVDVMRAWHLKSRVSANLADASIAQVKQYLLKQLQTMDLPDEERLATELQIREL
jgi:hypothetical protein